MYKVDGNLAYSISDKVSRYLKDNQNTIIMFTDFIKSTFPTFYSACKLEYPYTVNIPKSPAELMRGDSSPAFTITVNEPIMYEDTPIWFGNSTKQVYLRLGYLDGDRRRPSNEKLDDKYIHMLFGGRTGFGKSVLMNVLIYAMCLEYPWWELNLTMSDAKVVEFKSYALNPNIPHITTIAATRDVGYLISVLEYKHREMIMFNSIYARFGADKFETFRKKTDLALARNVIIFDEFQSMFTNAGKKKDMLERLIDDFARLGRNTAYNLILASQSLDGSIPKQTLSQITVRACLGATPDISDTILNNPEAGGIKQKGQLIFNNCTEVASESAKYNKRYTVPLMDTRERYNFAEFLNNLGKQYKCNRVLTFYDEEYTIQEKDYLNYLQGFKFNKDQLLLGEPSYIIEDKEKIIKLPLVGESFENIAIVNSIGEHLVRYSKMVKFNTDLDKSSCNIAFYSKPSMARAIGFIDNRNKPIGNTVIAKKIEDGGNENFLHIIHSVFRKNLAIDIDDSIFNEEFAETDLISEEKSVKECYMKLLSELELSREDFEYYKEQGYKENDFNIKDTKINRDRFNLLIYKLIEPKWSNLFGVTADEVFKMVEKNDMEFILDIALSVFEEYQGKLCCSSQLTRERFSNVYLWVVGFSDLVGLALGKLTNKEIFNSLLRESYKCNVRVIIVTNNFGEGGEVANYVKWFFLDNPTNKTLNLIKCSDYPDKKSIPPVLGFVYDKPSDKLYRFKKMVFDGEILV